MVLTDREIESSIHAGQILVDPPPNPEAFSSTSLDLTLARRAYVWRTPSASGVTQEIDPAAPGYSYLEVVKAHAEAFEIPSDGIVLKPRDFLLGYTVEDLKLLSTSRIAARVEGKSSLARLGIAVHVTAPTIHAGFHGTIQLEICNVGPLRVRLTPGMRVCQLIFEQTLGTPRAGYQGQFFGQ